jgi:predicted DNA-binding protein (MmcQ/YjbR family)
MDVNPRFDRQIPERLTELCLRFPEASVERGEGEHHLIFRVRARTFAYYLYDHHGDGEVAASFKVENGMNEALSRSDPERFFLPAYLAHRGWVSVRLKGKRIDWEEVADLIEMSYRLVAPRALARKIRDAT